MVEMLRLTAAEEGRRTLRGRTVCGSCGRRVPAAAEAAAAASLMGVLEQIPRRDARRARLRPARTMMTELCEYGGELMENGKGYSKPFVLNRRTRYSEEEQWLGRLVIAGTSRPCFVSACRKMVRSGLRELLRST